MYTSFEIHFAHVDITAIPADLGQGLGPAWQMDVSPYTPGLAGLLVDNLGFANYAFSVGVFTQRDVNVEIAALGSVFDWARDALARIGGDALFVSNDCEMHETTVICRRTADQVEWPVSGTALTPAFRAHLETRR